jgi:hypothetical protein
LVKPDLGESFLETIPFVSLLDFAQRTAFFADFETLDWSEKPFADEED